MSDTLILNKDGTPLSLLPLSVVNWQIAIRLVVTDKVRILKNHDNWNVRSPSITMAVPSVVITNDYIKWNRRVKFTRNNIFLRDDYTCQYCGKEYNEKHLSLDHVVPRSKGGKTNWLNIITSCKPCNTKRGANESIQPMKKCTIPSYYELVAKQFKKPIHVKDEYWKTFIPLSIQS